MDWILRGINFCFGGFQQEKMSFLIGEIHGAGTTLIGPPGVTSITKLGFELQIGQTEKFIFC